MNIRKMQKLQELGFDEEWLLEVKQCFRPKKRGKYQIKIYDIEDLSQEPEEGLWLDTTCFSTDLGLSFVHYFFEGNAYVMKVAETGEEIGRGIIDGAPFEEVEEYEGGTWNWIGRDQIKQILDEQRSIKEEQLSEGHARVRKRKIYVVTTRSKYDYDFSVETLNHGAYRSFDNAVARLKQEVKKFKKNHTDDFKEYSDVELYEDEDDGAWTEVKDFATGYWRVSFGYQEHYERHIISVDTFEIED